jgi:IS30 family transposase
MRTGVAMTGVRGVRADRAVVDRFWELRATGLATMQAAARAGLGAETARRLVQRCGGVRPRAPRPPSGRSLSLAEREEIAVGLAAGLTPAAIARQLGRHRSTICREIARQPRYAHDGPRSYRASRAQSRAWRQARRPKRAKLKDNAELRARVQADLNKKWSPREIAARLKLEFPDRPEMWVSHETIYQSLYVQSRGALRRELTACLRTGRAIRRPRRRADERRGRLKNMVMISERPAEVADRAVPGHWEGDLIIGRNHASAIGTLVERATRFVMLLHLPEGYQPERVQQQMIAQMSRLPAQLRRTLTWDQGKEMARHADISTALDMPIYFCDPHSPWQRGSNENTNGLLRQYFPKGTDLSFHGPGILANVAAELNARPRKRHDYRTPAEVLQELLSNPPKPTGDALTA